MPRLKSMPHLGQVMSFVRFSLYFMGILLIGGGIRKIYHQVCIRPGFGKEREGKG
ncbi:hypothetical protein ACFL0Q_09710 [Thermodesulfobacteriota bacterium]